MGICLEAEIDDKDIRVWAVKLLSDKPVNITVMMQWRRACTIFHTEVALPLNKIARIARGRNSQARPFVLFARQEG
jgi:hypothetical protein